MNNRGIIYFGVGSLFLVLIVLYILLALYRPEQAAEVTTALKNLSESVSSF